MAMYLGEDKVSSSLGQPGPKGDPFTYEDFTPEQLAALTGPQGPIGPEGPQGPSPSITDVLKAVYPVGSVYLSINNTNPSSIFGFGTWVKESGGYLYGCVSSISNSDYTGLNTQSGGSGTSGAYSGTSGSYSGTSGSTTLTADQMPSHTHGEYIDRYGGKTALTAANGGGTSVDGYYTDGGWNAYKGPQILTGSTGGGKVHSQSIPSHTDSIPSHTHSTPAHTHNVAHIGVFIWRRTA